MNLAFVRPRVLTLITTHQCTAACDHCCFGCTPRRTDRIPRERLTALIDEARTIPSLRAISFVGGECFLLGKELDEHFARAAALGFEVRTTTNGYWAVNARAAERRMTDARAAGLRAVSLSTGEMHAAYVPVERVIAGAVAACAAGLETNISIETFGGTTFDPRRITAHAAIAALVDAGRLSVSMRDWVAHADGNGVATLRHSPDRSRFAAGVEHAGCQIVLDDLTVTPQLDLVACCGYPVESIPELRLGSLATQTLGEALERTPLDPLALWLHVAGPERMLLFVAGRVADYALPLDAVHPCEVCLHLHRDPVALRVLRDRAPALGDALGKAYDVISKHRLAAS